MSFIELPLVNSGEIIEASYNNQNKHNTDYLKKRTDIIDNAVLKPEYYFDNIFESVELEESLLDPITTSSKVYTQIRTYGGAVNVLNYTHWTNPLQHGHITQITGLAKENAEQTGGRFVIEVPVVDGEHMCLFLKIYASTWNVQNVWYADPLSDAPVKRVGWFSQQNSAASHNTDNIWIGPDMRRDVETRYHHWMPIHLNKDDIAQYKTANNTINISICNNTTHGWNYIHLGGYAMCVNKIGVATKPAIMLAGYNSDGGTNMAGYGHYDESYMTTTPAGGTVIGVRIPVIDNDKDIVLGIVYHKNQAHHSTGIWKLVDTDKYYFPRMGSVGRYATALRENLGLASRKAVGGFVIPKEVVQANIKTRYDGYRYLDFEITNRDTIPMYFFGIYTEQIK